MSVEVEAFAEAIRRSRLREERQDVDGRWRVRPWAAICRAIERQALMDRWAADEDEDEAERLNYWFHVEFMGLNCLKDSEEVRLLGQMASAASALVPSVAAAIRRRT